MRRKQSSSGSEAMAQAFSIVDRDALREELISYGVYVPHRADDETLVRMSKVAKKRMEKRKTKEYRHYMAYAVPAYGIENYEL